MPASESGYDESMKKLLLILIISLFYSFNSQAFFSTAIFKKDKEINFNHLFNFDITKYKFEDHEDIIGSDFEKWNGDKKKLTKGEIDFKKINVLVGGKNQELSFRKFKNENWLTLKLTGYSCNQAKNKIPKQFINKKNYLEYVSDLAIMEMKHLEFSYENRNSRTSFFCMQLDGKSGSKDKNPIVLINVSSKDSEAFPQVTPLKAITCRLDEAKTNIKHEWSKMSANSYLNFFIQDSNKKLLDQSKNYAGKIKTFNEEKIHTIQKYKIDKTKKQNFYFEYIIDRTNGSFKYKKKSYNPQLLMKPRYGIKDGIIVVEYVGMCEKKTEKKKF